jgi:hypothetical protein
MSEIAKHWIGKAASAACAAPRPSPTSRKPRPSFTPSPRSRTDLPGTRLHAATEKENDMSAYLQFLEDSYATAASFRSGGCWTVQTEPGAEPFQA